MHKWMRTAVSWACCLILWAVGTACSPGEHREQVGAGHEPVGPSESTRAATPLRAHKAPVQFEGTPIPLASAALDGPTLTSTLNDGGDLPIMAGRSAYAASEVAVARHDLETGATTWEWRWPTHVDAEPQAGTVTLVLAPGGEDLFAIAAPALKTADSETVMDVARLDAGTGEPRWVRRFTLPDVSWPDQIESARILDVSHGRLVLTTSSSSGAEDVGRTQCLDADTGKSVWSYDGSAVGVARGVVLVEATTERPEALRLNGLDAGTGALRWELAKPEFFSAFSTMLAGGRLFVGALLLDGTGTFFGLNPVNGQILRRYDAAASPETQPTGDVLVDDIPQAVIVRDAATLQHRWHDANVVEARVFAGLIYGLARDGTGVVLDSSDGSQLNSGIPGRFLAVNEYGALMLRDGDVVFVPATG